MEQRYIAGDLVRYTSLCKGPIAEICEVRETSYLVRFMKGNFVRVTSQEIKPIPLTPAILEKNGWKDYFKGSIWKELATKRAYLYITKDQTTEDEYLVCCGRSKSNLASIKYVHQLQHLLFGLGINHEIEV